MPKPLNLHRRLLVITFVESFATIMVERGLYFLTHDQLGFSDLLNLWLALGFGIAYTLGALASHRTTLWAGERRLLLGTLAGAMLVHLAMAAWPLPWMMFAGSIAIGTMSGLKWPVIESFVSAGLTPRQTAGAIGWFNFSWASAVPLALLLAGPLIATSVWALFAAAAALNLLSLALSLPVPARPVHLSESHPERPPAGQLVRLGRLLSASRWLMLLSYGMMQILAALIPSIFERFDVRVAVSAGLSGLLDLLRLGAFLIFGLWTGWHGRRGVLGVALVALPLSFAAILSGASLPLVLAAEVVFGLSAGAIYYAALYYAMVVKNASVDASGAHEGLIGAGFAIGPGIMLLARAMAPALGSQAAGMALGVAPVILLCLAAAGRALVAAGRERADG